MPVSCEPNTLVTNAACFQCLDEKQQQMVQAYLLSQIAGVAADPEVLVVAAKQFQALSDKELMMVQAYLLCQILGGV